MSNRASDGDMGVGALLTAFRSGAQSPVDLARRVCRRIAALPGEAAVFISARAEEEVVAAARRLAAVDPSVQLPLHGVPFAVKDNIDVAGEVTTAACPAYAHIAERSAAVVDRLVAAGALYVGKTNLDQFATGLSGTRSPYGACANAFNERYISGGSSSGSAVAVARGLVSFALGTDTGGSGRIPAGFNHVVGVKPTRGLLSTRGVLANCRSLDCVSIFAGSVTDAQAVLDVARGPDDEDPSALAPVDRSPRSAGSGDPGGRFRFGVPRPAELEFFGDGAAARLFAEAVAKIESSGGRVVEIDFSPYQQAGRLLFEGPWVAERLVEIDEFVRKNGNQLHPVTRGIFESARRHSATDVFRAQEVRQALRRQAERNWSLIDALVVPSAPTVYTIDEMQAQPITLNNRLGTYSYFVNLLDLAALALPHDVLPSGVPLGVTLIGPRLTDDWLLRLGSRLRLGDEGRPRLSEAARR